MNILVSIIQILLGLWNITGGIYMSTHYEELITLESYNFFPPFFWITLAIIEILLGSGLILSLHKKLKKLAAPSAIVLAIIALSGIIFYIGYQGFPGMLWAIIPAILLSFIAYWRIKK